MTLQLGKTLAETILVFGKNVSLLVQCNEREMELLLSPKIDLENTHLLQR